MHEVELSVLHTVISKHAYIQFKIITLHWISLYLSNARNLFCLKYIEVKYEICILLICYFLIIQDENTYVFHNFDHFIDR